MEILVFFFVNLMIISCTWDLHFQFKNLSLVNNQKINQMAKKIVFIFVPQILNYVAFKIPICFIM